LQAGPVKQTADELGLPVIQPQKLREPEALARLQAWAPELIVVAAFGQMLRPDVLALPRYGCVNVHASLLPRHRGASPISAAIWAGDAQTGVTIMQMEAGLDTGPGLAARAELIPPQATTASLTERLADLGAQLLLETLPDYLAGKITPQPQDNTLATYAPQLKKEDGQLNFARPAAELERQVRACFSWPGAFAVWNGQPIKILRAAVAETAPGEPGQVREDKRGPLVVCGAGGLVLGEVQPAGKKPMPGAAFARGAKDFVGSRLV
jgi:methionyl-tRNA formyltransferase